MNFYHGDLGRLHSRICIEMVPLTLHRGEGPNKVTDNENSMQMSSHTISEGARVDFNARRYAKRIKVKDHDQGCNSIFGNNKNCVLHLGSLESALGYIACFKPFSIYSRIQDFELFGKGGGNGSDS